MRGVWHPTPAIQESWSCAHEHALCREISQAVRLELHGGQVAAGFVFPGGGERVVRDSLYFGATARHSDRRYRGRRAGRRAAFTAGAQTIDDRFPGRSIARWRPPAPGNIAVSATV